MELWELQQMQALPLDVKIAKSRLRIREWYTHYGGDVYVSFSALYIRTFRLCFRTPAWSFRRSVSLSKVPRMSHACGLQ